MRMPIHTHAHPHANAHVGGYSGGYRSHTLLAHAALLVIHLAQESHNSTHIDSAETLALAISSHG